MVVAWKVLFIAVLFSRAPFFLMDHVYQYIPGSLSRPFSINFTIFSDEVRGVILQIFDTDRNQFGIFVTLGSYGPCIRINYNKIYRLVNMTAQSSKFVYPWRQYIVPDMCRSCNVSKMTCGVRLRNGTLSVECNRSNSSVIVITNDTNDQRGQKKENSVNNMHPFPKTMTNRRETVYIMMGNIGPYVTEDGATMYPDKSQTEGCVEIFTFNNSQISLIESGTKLRSSCPHKCRNYSCNGGLCQEQSDMTLLCDCASTALNGMFCDRGLRKYVPGSNNSFEKVEGAHEVHLKLTWKHLLDKVYCLMDIVTGYKHATISINKSHLMLNSVNISAISIHEVNFVTVAISNNKLVVKAGRGEYKMEFPINETMTIDVGFSGGNTSCETFEGAYDLHFDSCQLRMVSTKLPNKKLISKPRGITELSNITTTKGSQSLEGAHGYGQSWTIVGISVTGPCILIFAIVIIALYLKSKKNLDSRIKKIMAKSGLFLASADKIFTETGLYDKVEDIHHYECVQDTEYSVIDEVYP